MNLKELFLQTSPRPVCVGTGFVALDIVMNGHPQNPIGIWVGGSCGNVLTILSYLGWTTFPIARIGNDIAGEIMMNELNRWKVKTDLLSRTDSVKTPLVIQKNRVKKDGSTSHTYDFYCPHCQHRLPPYKPTLLKSVDGITELQQTSQYFYFDRVQPSSIKLAKAYKRNGAMIFFEPSGTHDLDSFKECLEIADIVKMSIDRVERAQHLIQETKIPLTIVTLGDQGLQYKLGEEENWKKLEPYNIMTSNDTAGAGDWCSAGIIHSFFKQGIEKIASASRNSIEDCLMLGQAMGALNCYYQGARGAMYNLSPDKFTEFLSLITHNMHINQSESNFSHTLNLPTLSNVCPTCEDRLGNSIKSDF